LNLFATIHLLKNSLGENKKRPAELTYRSFIWLICQKEELQQIQFRQAIYEIEML
jgi:hypothetical protein